MRFSWNRFSEFDGRKRKKNYAFSIEKPMIVVGAWIKHNGIKGFE